MYYYRTAIYSIVYCDEELLCDLIIMCRPSIFHIESSERVELPLSSRILRGDSSFVIRDKYQQVYPGKKPHVNFKFYL